MVFGNTNPEDDGRYAQVNWRDGTHGLETDLNGLEARIFRVEDTLALGPIEEAEPVNEKPIAAFTSSVTQLELLCDATQSKDPDGSIITYAWDFGDGTTALGVMVDHLYRVEGSYVVRLTVTDNEGATDAVTQLITATAPAEAPNEPPVASFTQFNEDLTLSVNANGSTDSDGRIESYVWAFGDGNTGVGVTTSHSYSAAGTYTVKLTVTDDDGATGSATRSVTVTAPAAPNSGPTASFSASASDLSVTATSTSSDVDGTIIAHNWDFGDGNTATGTPAVHTYAVEGTYTVTLTVIDDHGLTDSSAINVTVVAPPVVIEPINIADSFDRPDGALGETSTGAKVWQGTGGMLIQGGMMSAHAVTANGLNYVDVGASTGYRVEATLTGTGDGVSTSTMSGGLAVRIEGSKFWYLAMRKTSTTHGMRLAKFNGSSYYTGTESDVIVAPGDRVAIEVFEADRDGALTPVVIGYHQPAGSTVWTEVSRAEGDFYNHDARGVGFYSTPAAVQKIDNLTIENHAEAVEEPQPTHDGMPLITSASFDQADGLPEPTADGHVWNAGSMQVVGGIMSSELATSNGVSYIDVERQTGYRVQARIARLASTTQGGGLAFKATATSWWYLSTRYSGSTPGLALTKFSSKSYYTAHTNNVVVPAVGDLIAVEVTDVYPAGSTTAEPLLVAFHQAADAEDKSVWTEIHRVQGDNFNNGALGIGWYSVGTGTGFDDFQVFEKVVEDAPDSVIVDPAGTLPINVQTTNAPDSWYRALLGWDETDAAAQYQVQRDGIDGSEVTITGGRYLTPHLFGGNHTFKVRKWQRSEDELQADGVTVITRQVYGPWVDAPTFIGRAWPIPVGNELQWSLPLDWGTRTDAPGVIVKTIAQGTTEIRMDVAGDYEWHLPADAPLQMPDNIRFSIKMGADATGPVRWTMIGGEIRSSLYSSAMIVKIVGANKYGMWWHVEGVKISGGAAEDSWQLDMHQPQHGHQQRQNMMHERIYGAKVEHPSHADGEQNFRGPVVNLYDRIRHDSDYQGGFWFPSQHTTLLQNESGHYGHWSWRNFEVRMYVQPDTGKTGIPIYTYHNAKTGFPNIHYEDGENGIFVRHMEPFRPDGVTPSQFPRDISHNAPLPIGNQQGEDSLWNRVQRSRVLADGTTEGVIPPNGTVLLDGAHTPGLGYVSPGYAAIPAGEAMPPFPSSGAESFEYGVTEPTAQNTGLTDATSLTMYTDSSTLVGSTDPTAPTIIRDKTIDKQLIWNSGYFRFENCDFTWDGRDASDAIIAEPGAQIQLYANAVGRVEAYRCRFKPKRSHARLDAVVGKFYTLDRCDISGTTDGLGHFSSTYPDLAVSVLGCYIHDMTFWTEAEWGAVVHPSDTKSHADNAQNQGGGGVVFEGNAVHGYTKQGWDGLTPAEPDNRTMQGYLIQQNVSVNGVYASDNIKVNRNFWYGTQTGIVLYAKTGGEYDIEMVGNRWMDLPTNYGGTFLPYRPVILGTLGITINGHAYSKDLGQQDDLNGNIWADVPAIPAELRGQPIKQRSMV